MIQEERPTPGVKNVSRLDEDRKETTVRNLSAPSAPPVAPPLPPPVVAAAPAEKIAEQEPAVPSILTETAVAWLYCIRGKKQGVLLPLEAEFITVGSADNCMLIVEDEQIAHYHAALIKREDGWLICDLGAAGGTLVNNRFAGRDTANPAHLLDGDRIVVGETEFVFKRI